ncbi:hypothetical protein L1887_58663 [Cichorium endivia]|nr:hypothetical protein L1887_58663 [Cichorium endivia]
MTCGAAPWPPRHRRHRQDAVVLRSRIKALSERTGTHLERFESGVSAICVRCRPPPEGTAGRSTLPSAQIRGALAEQRWRFRTGGAVAEMPTLSVSQPAREAERAMAVLPRAVPAEACQSSLRQSEACRSSNMPGHESLAEAASETLSVHKGVIRWIARHVAPRFRTLFRMTSRLPLCTAPYIRAPLILHPD